MTPADMAEVLAVIRVYDDRQVGVTDIAAWHAAVGHLDKDDAIKAVARHYAEHRERIMPADVSKGVREIRVERGRERRSDALALPSRWEIDEVRDARVRAGVAACLRAIDMNRSNRSAPREITE